MRFQPPSTSRSPRLACCLHFSIDHITYTFAVILLQQISSIAQSLQYGLNPGLAVELSIGIVRRSLRNKSNELRLYRRGPKLPDRNILYEARAYGGIVIIPILYLKSPGPPTTHTTIVSHSSTAPTTQFRRHMSPSYGPAQRYGQHHRYPAAQEQSDLVSRRR